MWYHVAVLVETALEACTMNKISENQIREWLLSLSTETVSPTESIH